MKNRLQWRVFCSIRCSPWYCYFDSSLVLRTITASNFNSLISLVRIRGHPISRLILFPLPFILLVELIPLTS